MGSMGDWRRPDGRPASRPSGRWGTRSRSCEVLRDAVHDEVAGVRRGGAAAHYGREESAERRRTAAERSRRNAIGEIWWTTSPAAEEVEIWLCGGGGDLEDGGPVSETTSQFQEMEQVPGFYQAQGNWEMSKPENMFSLLNLDAEDDGGNDSQLTQTSSTSVQETAASKPDKCVQNDTTIVSCNGGALASSSGGYRMPLVWIDLEMTGLDILKDRILEIACIVTDGKLTKQIEGPNLVISQSKACLDNMNEWCKTHHASSGLTERVLQSEISEGDAEKQVLDFLMKHVGSGTPSIAGNSVYVDLLFLKRRSDPVYLSSSFAERKQTPRKGKSHRAMDDIKESIAELKYYKANIFKPQKSKK
ncbi:oligoribonuclease-like [Hordeum vulgare]|nr:oligoribonuclease-like [Hordeum vulgare]